VTKVTDPRPRRSSKGFGVEDSETRPPVPVTFVFRCPAPPIRESFALRSFQRGRRPLAINGADSGGVALLPDAENDPVAEKNGGMGFPRVQGVKGRYKLFFIGSPATLPDHGESC
jgi:hypothetical protein